jgi:DNA-binding response OmpR family regulator
VLLARRCAFADLFVDSEKREAVRGGQRLELAFTEFFILECLMRSAGRVVKHDRIIDFVWAGGNQRQQSQWKRTESWGSSKDRPRFR